MYRNKSVYLKWGYAINYFENKAEYEKWIERGLDMDKYTKYKMCLSIMMVICIKQHLSNIWSSIYENLKQHWGWVEKKALLIKKAPSTKFRKASHINYLGPSRCLSGF